MGVMGRLELISLGVLRCEKCSKRELKHPCADQPTAARQSWRKIQAWHCSLGGCRFSEVVRYPTLVIKYPDRVINKVLYAYFSFLFMSEPRRGMNSAMSEV